MACRSFCKEKVGLRNIQLIGKLSFIKYSQMMGRGGGGGQEVSVLTFYSDNMGSNPAEVLSVYSASCLKRTTKKIRKVAGNGPL